MTGLVTHEGGGEGGDGVGLDRIAAPVSEVEMEHIELIHRHCIDVLEDGREGYEAPASVDHEAAVVVGRRVNDVDG